MSIFLLVSLVCLLTPAWMVFHTLAGFLLMPLYGVEKWRWREGAIEVQAKRKKDGRTRIWFQPGAQTWGLVIFCASRRHYEGRTLHVHERVHVLQTYIFGALYPATWLLAFVVLYVAVKLGAWKNASPQADNDVWRAYRRIPWEIWAYAKQRKFNQGKCPNAWGGKVKDD